MSFGRQRNMVRRANRPDESFNRDRRRKGLDRLAMLEASKETPRRQSWLNKLFAWIFRRGH